VGQDWERLLLSPESRLSPFPCAANLKNR